MSVNYSIDTLLQNVAEREKLDSRSTGEKTFDKLWCQLDKNSKEGVRSVTLQCTNTKLSDYLTKRFQAIDARFVCSLVPGHGSGCGWVGVDDDGQSEFKCCRKSCATYFQVTY